MAKKLNYDLDKLEEIVKELVKKEPSVQVVQDLMEEVGMDCENDLFEQSQLLLEVLHSESIDSTLVET